MLYLLVFMFIICWVACYVESVRVMYLYTPYLKITAVSVAYSTFVTLIAFLITYP